VKKQIAAGGNPLCLGLATRCTTATLNTSLSPRYRQTRRYGKTGCQSALGLYETRRWLVALSSGPKGPRHIVTAKGDSANVAAELIRASAHSSPYHNRH
jgi:hypothetical protein